MSRSYIMLYQLCCIFGCCHALAHRYLHFIHSGKIWLHTLLLFQIDFPLFTETSPSHWIQIDENKGHKTFQPSEHHDGLYHSCCFLDIYFLQLFPRRVTYCCSLFPFKLSLFDSFCCVIIGLCENNRTNGVNTISFSVFFLRKWSYQKQPCIVFLEQEVM